MSARFLIIEFSYTFIQEIGILVVWLTYIINLNDKINMNLKDIFAYLIIFQCSTTKDHMVHSTLKNQQI